MTPLEAGVRAWIEKAENDLLCIENNLAAARVPWDTVVFHAQQAAEKLLKALLVAAGEGVPRTHDLVALLSRALEAGFPLAGSRPEIDLLSRFGAAVRYPDAVYSPTEEDGRDMAAAASRLRGAVLGLLDDGRAPGANGA
jgi:HEPN domain-containing protein